MRLHISHIINIKGTSATTITHSPDSLVGIYTKPSNGTAEMHYAVTDHLGSLLALYKSNFTQTYSASYDPWGKQTITKNTLNLRRGYCLHEHWEEFSLIDMNGRFYDPLLGRFLSPDPYVQDCTNPQNFNRYAYCLNNPLKYTDPSGEFCVGAVIAGAVIGLYMGGTIANNSYNPIKWDYSSGKTWRYMGYGAIVGAASGYIGAEIATSGCAFANTTSIAMSSLINSVGTAAYTNGQTITGTKDMTLTAQWKLSTSGKTASTSIRTLSGQLANYSYKNPVIPQGFSAVDTTEAVWTYKEGTSEPEVTGWNNGLVISDGTNEFVWVPVDGINVKYEKWCTTGTSYSDCSDATNSKTVNGVTYKAIPVTESTQITKYGGFYVARYEAGSTSLSLSSTSTTPNNTTYAAPVSKKGAKVWNNVDYNHAYIDAEMMINNSSTYGNVKSGLITGTQWDTIMKWYKNSSIGIGTTDGTTQNWGSYSNITYTIQPGDYFIYTGSMGAWQTATSAITHTANSNNVSSSNSCIFYASGLNNAAYKKNIADMAGNLWEFTSEATSSTVRLDRGGVTYYNVSDKPITYRDETYIDSIYPGIGFRVVLYIQ